jgi:hypothetical protein
MLSKDLKERLIGLKGELGDTLKIIDNSLELLEKYEDIKEETIEHMEGKSIKQYEDLKKVVEKKDINYMINNLNATFKLEIGDSEKYLVEAIKESVKNTVSTKELITLQKLLKDFDLKYKLCMENLGCDLKSKFVYGVCKPQSDGKVLSKYDISKKKLITTINVPQHSSVIQIEDRIFISGGNNPYSNATSEYIEKTSTLVNKSPMNDSKYSHSLQCINKESFAAIGGFNGNTMTCCELYSIPDDKWELLPSLNKARCNAATVYLNHKLLYAIGGGSSDNTIEILNFNERKDWSVLNLTLNRIKLSCSSASLPISKDEILILSGNGINNTGIFDLTLNTIKKYTHAKVQDYYYYNAVSVINKKAYVLGWNGHMHIYDMVTKELSELNYSSISSQPIFSKQPIFSSPFHYPSPNT